jgi:hypothetical protein
MQIMADPDPGDPNTYGSYGSGSGSTTLKKLWLYIFLACVVSPLLRVNL